MYKTTNEIVADMKRYGFTLDYKVVGSSHTLKLLREGKQEFEYTLTEDECSNYFNNQYFFQRFAGQLTFSRCVNYARIFFLFGWLENNGIAFPVEDRTTVIMAEVELKRTIKELHEALSFIFDNAQISEVVKTKTSNVIQRFSPLKDF